MPNSNLKHRITNFYRKEMEPLKQKVEAKHFKGEDGREGS